jgi:hypothetical protein
VSSPLLQWHSWQSHGKKHILAFLQFQSTEISETRVRHEVLLVVRQIELQLQPIFALLHQALAELARRCLFLTLAISLLKLIEEIAYGVLEASCGH